MNCIEFDLGAFTGVGNGNAKELNKGYIYYTWQQSNNATNTQPDIVLEGSVDGVNWFDIDVSTKIGGELRYIINRPMRRFRVNIKSMGDATSISVKCMVIK
jgi:hypothetical protein